MMNPWIYAIVIPSCKGYIDNLTSYFDLSRKIWYLGINNVGKDTVDHLIDNSIKTTKIVCRLSRGTWLSLLYHVMLTS